MSKDTLNTDLHSALVQENVITQDQLNDFIREAERSKQSLIEVILKSKKFDDKALVHVLSNRYGYAAVNPGIFLIEPELLRLIPKALAEKYCVLPISRYEKTLTVAFANPTNLKAIEELQAITGLRIKISVASANVLLNAIGKYYSETKPVQEAETNPRVVEEQLDNLVKMIEDEQHDAAAGTEELLKVAFETPVIKLVNMLLIEGIRRHASDIFIEPWEDHVRVRARVDGLLEEIVRPQKSLASAIVSRIKVMSELNIAEHRVPQDGRFKVKLNEREVDMRVSILPSCFGEKVCLRILDTKGQSHEISKLGFTREEQHVIEDCAKHPHGMILVTGPTGSGKTTTLYSILKYLDSPEVNITTVEDPVEYQLAGINQVNVKEQIGLTFPLALRSILRQDPDVILIGEIRDRETLDIAVKAALTGHLVLSTLHTNDASSSITRMINMGLEPFLIASTVLMISAQRLVRRLCTRCRVPQHPTEAVLKQLGLSLGKSYTFYHGKGCGQCRQSGYSGRSVITEILKITPEIQKLIMDGKSGDHIKAESRKLEMTTLRECAILKALQGETSLEEVFRVTSSDHETSQEDKEASAKAKTPKAAA